jgi:ubiquinone/menaquinone biosynthesis C-methylase UbiE
MFTLDRVVPWGRSFEEYRRMFVLRDRELDQRIVDCGAGPASFACEAARRGKQVVACDPLYQWEASQIRERIAATSVDILEQARRNHHEFVWNVIRSVEELGEIRMTAMNAFLDDYDAGRESGRYVNAELPTLPFPDRSFDLALSSHFLFLYTTQLGDAFHRQAITEMCRVASEVRIFPLLALGGQPSPLVDVISDEWGRGGFYVSIEPVPYEFQRGGNTMMRIRPRK